MKILRIALENFQGIREFELTAKGGNVSIYGDNGTGKSTIYNAFTWLMYGKASTEEKGYTPKTIGSHHLNHIVEITMMLDDGSQATFKKDYHEVYKTKKGNADPIFSGHTSEYSIDGVPASEGEFTAKLKDLYKDEEIAKMLTSYNYFLEGMKVKDRRNKLLEICGDVDFDTVIKRKEELLPLPGILKKPGDTDSRYTVEEYQAIAGKDKKLIDKKLKEIPARIDEIEKSKPDVGGLDRIGLEAEIDLLQRKKAELELQKKAPADTRALEKRLEISKAKEAYEDARHRYVSVEHEKHEAFRRELLELTDKADAIQVEINFLGKKKRERQDNVREMTECRERLMKKWKEERARQWEGTDICPTCGQPLPADQVEKAKENFNIEKSKRLEDIKKRGEAVSKDAIEAEELKVAELEAQISAKKAELEKAQALVNTKKAAQPAPLPFSDTKEGQELQMVIDGLNNVLANIEKSSEDVSAPIVEELRKLDEKIKDANQKLSSFAFIEKANERRSELETEEQELSQKYESLSQGLYLCDLYTKTKAEALDEKVNSHFETLKFKLFTEQLNGGVSDDCEALIPCGDTFVPFKSANNAARINAGLEVIDALGAFYGVSLPVFIDNAESCTIIRPTEAQQFRLYVSEQDETLRTENE